GGDGFAAVAVPPSARRFTRARFAVQEVVVTGLGIVCPIGVGADAVWRSVEARRSGVRVVPELAEAGVRIPIAGDVADFDPKQWVKPRKSLKVMSRETQLGFT